MIMFIGSILYFLGFNIPFDSSPYFPLIFGFAIVAIVPFSIYRAGKKTFSANPGLRERIIYEITDEKIKQIGETQNTEMNWTTIDKVLELKNWILIYQNKKSAFILPKESFGDQLIEFREIVKNKSIKSKLRK